MPHIPDGRYTARGVAAYLKNSKSGSDYLDVEFEVTEGEHAGTRLRWIGTLKSERLAKTVDQLDTMGWKGSDPVELHGSLEGLADNAVHVIVESEEYNGKPHSKIRWVNRIGGGAAKGAATDDEAKRIGAKYKAEIEAVRKKAAAPFGQQTLGADSKDDIPF